MTHAEYDRKLAAEERLTALLKEQAGMPTAAAIDVRIYALEKALEREVLPR